MPRTLEGGDGALGAGERRGDSDPHIIHIAKPTSLGLLRMMQPPCPINRDIRHPLIYPLCRTNTSPGTDRTEFENTFKGRTVFTRQATRAAAREFFCGLGHDAFEEVDVFVGVEAGELGFGGAEGALRVSEPEASERE